MHIHYHTNFFAMFGTVRYYTKMELYNCRYVKCFQVTILLDNSFNETQPWIFT